LWFGDHVRWRRHGRSRNFRAHRLSNWQNYFFTAYDLYSNWAGPSPTCTNSSMRGELSLISEYSLRRCMVVPFAVNSCSVTSLSPSQRDLPMTAPGKAFPTVTTV